MASAGKSYRSEGKMSSSRIMSAGLILVAFCLVGAWVLKTSEPEIVKETKKVSLDVEMEQNEDTGVDNQALEDRTGNLALENDAKSEEAPGAQEILHEEDQELSSGKKISSKHTEKDAESNGQLSEDKSMSKREKQKEGRDSELSLNEEDTGEAASDIEKAATKKSEKSVEDNSEIEIEYNDTIGDWDTQAGKSKTEKEKVRIKGKQRSYDALSEYESVSDEKPEKKTVKETRQEEMSTGDELQPKQVKEASTIVWTLCNFKGAADHIPCLDNQKAIKALPSTKHYEHRERHCPVAARTCLIPLPDGYRLPVQWPQSRKEVWYNNVPYPGLVSYKKDQNWVKKAGNRLVFPGGGTQFKNGALHYIDFIEQTLPLISWGKRTRVVLDVGCGVGSFGGYMFDRNVLTMSFAPKDEHEAQVQLALERGIPAISSVMGTQRLVFPSNVYDVVHCARCRVPWHIEGGKLLLELNRVLRPGGFFVWSATPVYWTNEEDVAIWKAMKTLTSAICWKLVAKATDSSIGIGVAIFRKPTTNTCYEARNKNAPPMCLEENDSDAAWYVPITACIQRIPDADGAHGSGWPQEWPARLTAAPEWLNNEKGWYDKPTISDFQADTDRWQRIVQKSYFRSLGIDWKRVRNVMDMRAVYGGFAAALASQPLWVMNVVQYDGANTLPIIFDRGLFGIYHDWCESFSSYPRTMDLLHADHLLSKLKERCSTVDIVVEMHRLLRPLGWAIFRDKAEVVEETRTLLESMHWNVQMNVTNEKEALLVVQKSWWRPEATS